MLGVEAAVNVVTKRFGVTCAELESHARPWRLVWPRWVLIYLLRWGVGLEPRKIALLVNRDKWNTGSWSVRYALASLDNQVNCYPKDRAQWLAVKEEFAEALANVQGRSQVQELLRRDEALAGGQNSALPIQSHLRSEAASCTRLDTRMLHDTDVVVSTGGRSRLRTGRSPASPEVRSPKVEGRKAVAA